MNRGLHLPPLTPPISGQPIAAIGVNRDITERKQYENQLVEAREAAVEGARAKAQFLANMSHEIRTPMNGVLGMSELLLSTELTTRQLDFVKTLQVSGDHLLRVINDILDFSKLEAGEMRLDTDEFDLNRCLEEVLDLFTPQADVVKKDLPGEKSNSQSKTSIAPTSELVDWVRLKEISQGEPAFQLELVQGFIKEAATSELVAQLEQILERLEASVDLKKFAIESKPDSNRGV